MALLLFDGFDLYTGAGTLTGLQSGWTSISGTTGVSLVAGRFGGQAVAMNDDASAPRRIYRNLPAGYAAVGVGVAVRVTNVDSLSATVANNRAMTFTDAAASSQFGLCINLDGSIGVYRATSLTAGTLLGTTAADVITEGTWHYIEVGVAISDTVGTVVVKVDGAEVLNLAAQDTRNGAPTTVGRIYLSAANISGSTNFDFDDFYVVDSATTLGERRARPRYATSDVAQGFARSAGAVNFSLIDEATVNGDTDYVQGSTVGDVDTYGFADYSGTGPTVIDGVQAVAFALKTDAASRSIALQAKSGATTSDGPDFALAASYGRHERLMLVDPNTAAAWTVSGVNALQGGPKVTI